MTIYNHVVRGALLLIALQVTGCAPVITGDNLFKQILDGNVPRIIDVRTRGEYDSGHVPGAVHIPFYAIRSSLKAMGIAPEEPVVLYCEHGPRSQISRLLLVLSGFERVSVLEGQMRGWRRKEFPLVSIIH